MWGAGTLPGMSGGRVYGGKTAQERAAERRTRLLDAGLQLFGTAGYAATTIEAICGEAGLNPRYFYEQFETREALLRAVYERGVEQVLQQVVAAIADSRARGAELTARGQLEAGLRAFIEATMADERSARITYFEIPGVSRELEARRRAALRTYADMIVAQARSLPHAPRLLTGPDPRRAAVALVSATDGLIVEWLTSEEPQGGSDEIVATLLDIFAPADG